MSGEYIRAARPYFPEADINHVLLDIARSLKEGRLRNGKNLQRFEQMFAQYIGVENAIAVDADGSALEIALKYYDVKGHEVAVCTNSFISIPNSVLFAGARPVFVDIKEETLSMDPDSLLENISEKTYGVIVTHIAGFPNPNLAEIIKICQEHKLFLIEDATHAAGAVMNGKKMGNFGDAAVFAFTPTKVLTTGEGGMLATDDRRLSEEARRVRYYGAGKGKSEFVQLGRHMLLPEVSAILGIYQLRRIEEFIDRRNKIARIYDRELGKVGMINPIGCPSNCRSSYYKYPVVLDEQIDKLEFIKVLEDKYKVETGTVFYPPCHLQPFYRRLSKKNKLPTSERVLSKTITLPIHAAMSAFDASYVLNSLKTSLSSLGA